MPRMMRSQFQTERLLTIKSYRTRLNTLSTQLDYQVDHSSIISALFDEKYESCLTADSLSQIESFLNEV